MNLILEVISNGGVFFAGLGFLVTVACFLVVVWMIAVSVRDAIKRRLTPRIPAPKPMPPLDQRVLDTSRPRVDPDRMAAVMQRVGEGIHAAAQARTEPTPEDIRQLHEGIERLCRDAGSDTTDHWLRRTAMHATLLNDKLDDHLMRILSVVNPDQVRSERDALDATVHLLMLDADPRTPQTRNVSRQMWHLFDLGLVQRRGIEWSRTTAGDEYLTRRAGGAS